MDEEKLSFLQINLHRSVDANDALADYVLNFGIDCIVCQDPHISNSKLSSIPSSWSTFLSNNNNAAIVFTNNNYTVISTVKFDNSIFVNLSLKDGGYIIIGSQYSSPSSNIDTDCTAWSAVFPDYEKILLAGDFNVHIKDLGYSRENTRTEEFMEHLVTNGLFIMNDPEAPHSWIVDKKRAVRI